MARVRLTYVTPMGQIFPIDIAQEDDIETIGNLLSMVLVVDTLAQDKGLSIMGKKLETTPLGAKAAAPPKADGAREGNVLYKVVSIDILPKPDGQVQVAFFGNEFGQPRNMYATVFVNTHDKFPVESIQALLAPYHTFKLETFQKAGTYNVDFLVEYWETKDKVNSKGNPYKNVARIHVEDGAKKPSVGKAPPQPEGPPPSGPEDIPF